MANQERVLERRFAAEIDRRAVVDPVAEVVAVDVGDALSLDPLEVVNVMTWLIGERLVMEVRYGPDGIPMPWSEEALALTRRGREFVTSGVVPPR